MPREEGFLDMLKYTLFSTFRFRSLTFTVMLVNCVFYVSSLWHGGVVPMGQLLEPTQGALFDFGMNYAYFTRYKQEVHRLVLSLFLYCNFVHFATSQIGWAMYGSYVERLVGWKKLFMVGALGGVGGTLLSSALTPWPHVNGTSLPCAFIGFLLGYLLLKWDSWDYSGSGRWQMLGWLVFGSVVVTLECKWWVLQDEVGNLGSGMLGLLESLVLVGTLDKEKLNTDHKCTSVLASMVLVVFFIVVAGYFWFYTNATLLANQ